MEDMYYVFSKALLDKLKFELNGRVEYKVYPQIDTVIFSVRFKDFVFEYPIKDVQDKVHNAVSTDQIVVELKDEYKAVLLGAFFKSDKKKAMVKDPKYMNVY